MKLLFNQLQCYIELIIYDAGRLLYLESLVEIMWIYNQDQHLAYWYIK